MILATVGPGARLAAACAEPTTFEPRAGSAGAELIVRRPLGRRGRSGWRSCSRLAIPALSMNTGQPSANSLGGNGRRRTSAARLEPRRRPERRRHPDPGAHARRPGRRATRRARSRAATPGVYAALAPGHAHFRQAGDSLITRDPAPRATPRAGQATVARAAHGAARASPAASRSAATPRREHRLQPRRLRQLPADARR